MNKRRVGVIGGSGIYNLPNLESKKLVKVDTPML
jgi:purine nucleoside phosphorylase